MGWQASLNRDGIVENVVFELKDWPLVYIKFAGKQSAESLKFYQDSMEEVLAREEPHVVVHHIQEYKKEDAVFIRDMGEWMKKVQKRSSAYCKFLVIVPPSKAFSFVLSTVFLITPMPVPSKVTSNLDEALTWAKDEIQRLGLKA